VPSPQNLLDVRDLEMQRPWLLRWLPPRLAGAVAWHFYRPRREQWLALYDDAPLRFTPQCRMALLPGDVISDRIAFSGVYDLPLSRHLMRRAAGGGAMIEIGANLGYFSLLWASAHPANRCYSFEASPPIAERLRQNIERNNLGSRIEVIPLAAGKESGSVAFDIGPPDQTGWGGITLANAGSVITVDVVRVDEVLRYSGPISFLKIDVEGADTWALMGCERLFRERRVKEVWFEQNRPRMRNLGIADGEAQAYLESLGFSLTPQGDPASDTVDWLATLREDRT